MMRILTLVTEFRFNLTEFNASLGASEISGI